MSKRKTISTRTRLEMSKRDGFTCRYGGKKPPMLGSGTAERGIFPVLKRELLKQDRYAIQEVDQSEGKE